MAEPAKGSKWKRRLRKVGLAFLGLCVILFAVMLVAGYRTFRQSFQGYQGVRLNDTRAEVLYRMGDPPSVLGPRDGEKDRPVMSVSGAAGAEGTMPPNTKPAQYAGWLYEPEGKDGLLVDFSPANRVERLSCMTREEQLFHCGYPAGLYIGSSEERVLKLGRPTKIILSGPNKRILFDDIGLTVYLQKGNVVALSLTSPTGGPPAFVRRFLNSLH